MNSIDDTVGARPTSSLALDPRGESSHIEELEGLFAGVGLLNELEPVIDQDPAPHSPDHAPLLPSPWASPRRSFAESFAEWLASPACNLSLLLFNMAWAGVFVGTVNEHVLQYD